MEFRDTCDFSEAGGVNLRVPGRSERNAYPYSQMHETLQGASLDLWPLWVSISGWLKVYDVCRDLSHQRLF